MWRPKYNILCWTSEVTQAESGTGLLRRKSVVTMVECVHYTCFCVFTEMGIGKRIFSSIDFAVW